MLDVDTIIFEDAKEENETAHTRDQKIIFNKETNQANADSSASYSYSSSKILSCQIEMDGP